MNNLLGIGVSIVFMAVVLGLSMVVQKLGNEVSRKFVHIGLSNIWFIYMLFIDNIIVACILPACFVVINSLSYKFNLIKSMEREEKDSLGTVYYAISILVISIFSYAMNRPEIGLLGMLTMGYGDGFAAVIGQNIPSKEFTVCKSKKSIAGSLTMFLITLAISIVMFYCLGIEFFILKAFGIAAFATILEMFSIGGIDNLTVPILVTILTYFAI